MSQTASADVLGAFTPYVIVKFSLHLYVADVDAAVRHAVRRWNQAL